MLFPIEWRLRLLAAQRLTELNPGGITIRLLLLPPRLVLHASKQAFRAHSNEQSNFPVKASMHAQGNTGALLLDKWEPVDPITSKAEPADILP